MIHRVVYSFKPADDVVSTAADRKRNISAFRPWLLQFFWCFSGAATRDITDNAVVYAAVVAVAAGNGVAANIVAAAVEIPGAADVAPPSAATHALVDWFQPTWPLNFIVSSTKRGITDYYSKLKPDSLI